MNAGIDTPPPPAANHKQMNWVVFLGTVISRGSIENRAAQREFAPWMGSFDGSVQRVLLSVWLCSWGEALQYLQWENGTSSSGRGLKSRYILRCWRNGNVLGERIQVGMVLEQDVPYCLMPVYPPGCLFIWEWLCSGCLATVSTSTL